MKKLLFISNITNAITNFSLPSILAAQKLGYEVHMAADFSGFNDDGEKYNVTLHHIDLKRFPLHPQNLKAYSQMNSLIKKEGFDVIHCNTPIGGVLGRLCGSRNKVRKIIYTAHGFHFYKGAPLVNTLIYKTIEKLLAHKTDVIITMNSEDKEAAQELKLKKGGRVYFVKGVGITAEDFDGIGGKREEKRQELSLSDNDVALVSAGDLILRKNYATAIKAIAECKNQNLKYFICGKGPQKENLEALIKELNVENKVFLLGFRSDVKEIMAASDIFLFTTLQEGMPRSMMEAMTLSLPCVASKIRGNVDLIENENGGFLCAPTNYLDFAAAIDKLANDKALRERMGQINKISSKEYDSKNIIECIEKIYAENL